MFFLTVFPIVSGKNMYTNTQANAERIAVAVNVFVYDAERKNEVIIKFIIQFENAERDEAVPIRLRG